MREKDLSKQISDYLTIQENAGKLIFFRTNSFCGAITRPDGSKGWVKNNKPGVADYFMLLPNGYYLLVELKSDKGKQSQAQKDFQDKVERLCGYYQVVKSLDVLIETIKDINGQ